VATLLLAGPILLDLSPAAACSCIGGTRQQLLDRSDVVFTGELIQLVPFSRGGEQGPPMSYFRFRTDQVFKGVVGDEIEVVATRGGAACGFDAVVGDRMVVLASDEPHFGGLTSGSCNGSQLVGQGTPRWLHAGADPEPSIAAPPDRVAGVKRPLFLALGAAAAAALAVAAVLRSRRPAPPR
jgi:hypothetical protein